ncbi:MAG: homocysteine S-methyltransferase family protein [Phycisphaerales bacterium]|nr:MAG: homocysteine S-methyltransferase family protein [Phycisphaerales bacterium]
MESILERLRAGETLLGDGAMGTMLQQCAPGGIGTCPEAINLERPELLEEIARRYLDAGAELIETNTFGASPLKLAAHGLENKTEEINRRAVEAVRTAVGGEVGGRAYVSGSCGPCGRMLKPYGDADPELVREGFVTQMRALADAGVDVICIETMTDLAEAVLALQAAKEAAPGIPVIATMTFDLTARGFFTMMGVSVEKAAAGLQEAGADVVGSNCGNGIEKMIEVARLFRQCTDLPIIIQSNAGLPEMKDGELVYSETPEFMADKAGALVDIGVSIIGGCCGTTPDHIRALKKMIDSRGDQS